MYMYNFCSRPSKRPPSYKGPLVPYDGVCTGTCITWGRGRRLLECKNTPAIIINAHLPLFRMPAMPPSRAFASVVCSYMYMYTLSYARTQCIFRNGEKVRLYRKDKVEVPLFREMFHTRFEYLALNIPDEYVPSQILVELQVKNHLKLP